MSDGKRILTICITAFVTISLLLAVVLISVKTANLSDLPDRNSITEHNSEYFTKNDLTADWDTSDASFITLTGSSASITGGCAYFADGNIYIYKSGSFIVSGELNNGRLIINAAKDEKVRLLFDDVTINCNDNAAIYVEQAEKVFITLKDGSRNVLSNGAKHTSDKDSKKIDGVIYSGDDLTINGNGNLIITAEYKHGIVCKDDLVITGGNITVDAVEDGINANDSARFTDTNLCIKAGDDGISVSNKDENGFIYFESGCLSLPECHEGLEANCITIAGGEISICPTEDGINANSSEIKSEIRITDGDISIINAGGSDADGLDSNGNIFIEGGSIFISVNCDGTSTAIDYGSENGGICKISGGTVIACGSSDMAECLSDSSTQCSFLHKLSKPAPADTAVSLKTSDGTEIISETLPNSFDSILISTPELKLDTEYSLEYDNQKVPVMLDKVSSVI